MENVLSTYGRINSIITSIFVGVVGIILFAFAIHLLREPKRTGKAVGKVVELLQNNMINVSFQVGKQGYFVQSQGNYQVGDKVNVIYDVNNPTNARLASSMSNKEFGLLLIGITIIIVGFAFIITYFTMKSKTFAAVEGGMDIAHQISEL